MSNPTTEVDLLTEISDRTNHILPDIIGIRRHLHRHPEASGVEFGTTEYLARLVESIGLQPHICDSKTGLTCDFVHRDSTASAGPSASSGSAEIIQRLVLRGDIDALPIQDAKTIDYRSTHAGLMHACGHDVHPAIVFGSLRLLCSLRRDGLLPWPIAVRGLFQPAEETATGASAMIRAHALRDVAAAIALHVDPTRSVGTIGLRHGTLTASCDTFQITITGKGGHGSRPHLVNDPIEAAAVWILTAYRRVHRRIDAHQPTVISVGKITAGQAPNVIPDVATLEGTVRTLSKTTRRLALEAIEDVNESIEKQFGVQIRMSLIQSAPAVQNDSTMTSTLSHVAEQVVCSGCIDWIEHPSMGSEDFSYYLDHVPGVMFRLGVAGEQVGHAPLHTPLFDIDERALAVGIRLMTVFAIEYFRPLPPSTTPFNPEP